MFSGWIPARLVQSCDVCQLHGDTKQSPESVSTSGVEGRETGRWRETFGPSQVTGSVFNVAFYFLLILLLIFVAHAWEFSLIIEVSQYLTERNLGSVSASDNWTHWENLVLMYSQIKETHVHLNIMSPLWINWLMYVFILSYTLKVNFLSVYNCQSQPFFIEVHWRSECVCVEGVCAWMCTDYNLDGRKLASVMAAQTFH